jgi:hypothetical protein
MSGMMLHGMGDCARSLHCGCLDRPISDERLAELRDAAARSRFPTVRAMLSDLVAEIDRLRALPPGETQK